MAAGVVWLKTLMHNLEGLPLFGWREAFAFVKAVWILKLGTG